MTSASQRPVPALTDKTELRRALRARRAALAPAARREAARRLAVHVAATDAFRVSRRIAAYLTNNGEIDPARVLVRAQRMGKRCFLPVLSRRSWDRLWFAPIEPGVHFRPNRFGILEPQVPAVRLVRADELDLILMPLVAFDARGNRLGMGGGFYDRSLEFLAQRHRWHKPRLLGLAYEFQRVDNLTPDGWDIPLDGVVTDNAVYWSPGR
jgi:5-formyltetrahydrofolate cyclo-ligase